jgi:hypothetical protein
MQSALAAPHVPLQTMHADMRACRQVPERRVGCVQQAAAKPKAEKAVKPKKPTAVKAKKPAAAKPKVQLFSPCPPQLTTHALHLQRSACACCAPALGCSAKVSSRCGTLLPGGSLTATLLWHAGAQGKGRDQAEEGRCEEAEGCQARRA